MIQFHPWIRGWRQGAVLGSRRIPGSCGGGLQLRWWLCSLLFWVSSATYAWYIYNTSRHTTNVRMAAGAGVNLQISNSYSGTYGSAAVLDSFAGQLVPVSTNRISGGFQKVLGFTEGSSQSGLVASIFGSGEQTDYYQTSLFLRTNGTSTDIYLSDIGFEDSDEKNPISSAIRVGLVVHQAGQNQSVDGEYIFAISDKNMCKCFKWKSDDFGF